MADWGKLKTTDQKLDWLRERVEDLMAQMTRAADQDTANRSLVNLNRKIEAVARDLEKLTEQVEGSDK